MSLTLNMIGGGSGGFSPDNAILGITAYAGSTVTISNGTVIKTVTPDKGYLLSTSNSWAIYYFTISQEMFDSEVPWNIVALYEEQEATGTIIINTNAFYDIELTYTVPYDYQQVEYLQSNGAQYIDTLIKTNIIGVLNCRFMTSDYSTYNSSAYHFSFGGCDSLPTSTYNPGGGFGWYADRDSRRLRVGSGSYYYNVNSLGTVIPCYISFKDRTTTINNTTNAITQSISTGNNFYLFTINNGGTTYLGAGCNNVRFYSCEIFNYNNEKIANLIPCYRKIGQVAGMYDNVRKIFLTNSGTGSFTVGAIVT